jgi:DNA-binding MarR family transcriptional regulator
MHMQIYVNAPGARGGRIALVSAQLEKLISDSGFDPVSCVLRNVTRTSRLVAASYDAVLIQAGLTGNQFSLLMVLARCGPMNVNKLASAVGVHPSTTPRLIAPLERDGLVRTHAGVDRRVRLIKITRKGTQKLARGFPLWAELQRRIVTELGDREWASAMVSLKNIRNAFRQAAENR